MKNVFLIETDKPSRLYLHSDSGLQLMANITRTQGDYLGCNQYLYITSNEQTEEGDFIFDTYARACPKIRQLNTDEEVLEVQKSEFKIVLTNNEGLIKDGVQPIPDEFLEWFVKNPSCEYVELKKGFADGTDYGYNFSDYKIIIPKDESKQDYNGVHLRHCYKGEYEDSCKYGENDCPAKPLEELKQVDCCTPIGQIKRYVDCKGCDRKPKKKETLEEAVEILYPLLNVPEATNVNWTQRLGKREGFLKGVRWQAERSFTKYEVLKLYKDWMKLDDNQDSFNGKDYINFKKFLENYKKK